MELSESIVSVNVVQGANLPGFQQKRRACRFITPSYSLRTAFHHQPATDQMADERKLVINGKPARWHDVETTAAAAVGDVNWMKYSEGACDGTRVLGRAGLGWQDVFRSSVRSSDPLADSEVQDCGRTPADCAGAGDRAL